MTLFPWRSSNLAHVVPAALALVFSLVSASELSAQATADWIMDAEAAKKYSRSEFLRDRGAMRSSNPSSDQTRQIRRIVHYYMSQLTHGDQNNLPKFVVERLLNNELNLSTTKARELAMEEILAKAPDLLTHPEDIVRYNTIALVIQLSTKPAQYSGGTEIPAVPFNPAHKLLVQVLQDESQFLDTRILAAKGLHRILKDGEGAPSSNEKSDIATALVNTLAASAPSSQDGNWWFRYKMIEALGYVDRIDNSATQPIVLESLIEIIANPREVWINRAQAAQSITQLPYPSSVNVQLITHEIAKMLADMSAAAVKAPNSPGWRDPFVRVYLAYRPATQKQASERKWGLLYQVSRSGLGSAASYVQDSWNVAFPVVSPYFQGVSGAPSGPAVQALNAWIQMNPPANRQIVTGGKTIPESPAPAPASAVKEQPNTAPAADGTPQPGNGESSPGT